MQQRTRSDSCGVALSWDSVGRTIDVDLQALLVDRDGIIVDAVFYNRPSAFHDAVVHAGDSVDGANAGYDETIFVKPQHLPETLVLIIFVIGIHAGGTLRDVASGVVTLFDNRGPVVRLPMEQSHGSVDCVAVLKRSGHAWNFHKIDEAAEMGHTFLDILEPTIGDVIRKHIPNAPVCVDVDFDVQLQKERVVDHAELRVCWLEKVFTLGVGWDFDLGANYGKGVNVDASAVFFDSEGRHCHAIYGAQKKACGAVHSGDNRSGRGAGDDEKITVDLASVPAEVAQIFFIVNVRTPGHDLSTVQGGFCRILGDTGEELARHAFGHGDATNGKIVARLIRSSTSRWCLQTLAENCQGRTWMSATQTMCHIFRSHPKELQPRKEKEVRRWSTMKIGFPRLDIGGEKKPKTARHRAAIIKRNLRRQALSVQPPPSTQESPRARFLMSL
uniref:TerD domain-containing protein n=1 Tax=Noctiluca scintillans TaxID=2966 RepID=A0A7S1AD05_NOCSC|mmetsp:Transcript_40833/g.108223  ORF Transcript_40833/g.108223 Transcript_40833/m.108223 type:complete len:444 (+) Transcript_40833:51-1382(+)